MKTRPAVASWPGWVRTEIADCVTELPNVFVSKTILLVTAADRSMSGAAGSGAAPVTVADPVVCSVSRRITRPGFPGRTETRGLGRSDGPWLVSGVAAARLYVFFFERRAATGTPSIR